MNISLIQLCKELGFDERDLELLSKRDTSDVWRQFAIWILVDPNDGVRRFTEIALNHYDSISKVAQLYWEMAYDSISKVAQLYIDDCKDIQTWEIAAEAARDDAATLNASADNYCVVFVARAAYWAARAADTADYFLAYTAVSCASYAANYFSHAAFTAAFTAAVASKGKQKNKLIELIKAAPMITTND